ncbi:hypothetical protein SOMG_03700 [Schizosaccharomyces osmophilus]|uniref:Uncharacterized protein n=1 Tax=Schizosaccharomyces osmophilus TaxID=2545709 RepID=A0AAE9WEI9_9SCHI|nr:uncharacterized protein SOMG_03700 [Schizosaccharomyces osmophilus]WBW74184.1 hypothetical protein SOMG_03700 [Schizosaccharomyces osmophilus]
MDPLIALQVFGCMDSFPCMKRSGMYVGYKQAYKGLESEDFMDQIYKIERPYYLNKIAFASTCVFPNLYPNSLWFLLLICFFCTYSYVYTYTHKYFCVFFFFFP